METTNRAAKNIFGVGKYHVLMLIFRLQLQKKEAGHFCPTSNYNQTP